MPRLRTVSPSDPGISRRRQGRGFAYLDRGERVTDAAVLERIKSLVIPPAWERRLGLPLAQRAHPGRRARTPPVAASTSTTRSGGCSGTRPSTTGC